MTWTEEPDGRMSRRAICPAMSDSRGIVLCQGKNCAAAYPIREGEKTTWACRLIGEHPAGEEDGP